MSLKDLIPEAIILLVAYLILSKNRVRSIA